MNAGSWQVLNAGSWQVVNAGSWQVLHVGSWQVLTAGSWQVLKAGSWNLMSWWVQPDQALKINIRPKRHLERRRCTMWTFNWVVYIGIISGVTILLAVIT